MRGKKNKRGWMRNEMKREAKVSKENCNNEILVNFY